MNADDTGFFDGFAPPSKPLLKVFHTTSLALSSTPTAGKEKEDEPKHQTAVFKPRGAAPLSEANKAQLQSEVAWFDLGLAKPLLKAVCEAGYVTPTLIQVKAIPAVMQGYDVCARAVTGSGKTAAYLLPVLHRLLTTQSPTAGRQCIRVLVLTPTRELAVQCMEMKDQLTAFCNYQVVSCISIGGMPSDTQAAQLRRCPDMVIGTPGRIIDMLYNQKGISFEHLEVLVFDEADKMLQEGFAEMVDEIIKFCPEKRQTLLFSATMTRDVDALAKLALQRPLDIDVGHIAVASQLTQEFIKVPDEDKKSKIAMLHVLVTKVYPSRCVVFAKYLTTVRRLKAILESLEVSVVGLHGNMTMEDRIKALDLFGNGHAAVMVATELAARGLDFPGVDTVINYDMPQTLTSYIHRVGRTARIGHDGRAVSFVGPLDEDTLSKVRRLSESRIGGVAHTLLRREMDASDVRDSQKRVDAVFEEVREALKGEDIEHDLDATKRRVESQLAVIDAMDPRQAAAAASKTETSWFETPKQKKQREMLATTRFHNSPNDIPEEEIQYEKYQAFDPSEKKPNKPKKTAGQKLQEYKDMKDDQRRKNRGKNKKLSSVLDLKGQLPKGKFKRVRKTEERRQRKQAIALGTVKARPQQKKKQHDSRKQQRNFKSASRYKRR